MTRGFYARVTRYEWQVEERAHMQCVRAGWLNKASRSKTRLAPNHRRLYGVLSTRSLYVFNGERDEDPLAFIRLEGMCCRPRGYDGKEDKAVRMVKLVETADGMKQEPSKHSTFLFTADTEREAQLWAAALADYTMDVAEGDCPPSATSIV